jgi:isopenicillin N synthase-like dioxygenase
LQFRSPSGDWLDAHNTGDSFSVLPGEALQMQSCGRFVATPHRILGYGQIRQSVVFFLEPNLFSSIQAFSSDSNDIRPFDSDTYAASMLETLRKTGRA